MSAGAEEPPEPQEQQGLEDGGGEAPAPLPAALCLICVRGAPPTLGAPPTPPPQECGMSSLQGTARRLKATGVRGMLGRVCGGGWWGRGRLGALPCWGAHSMAASLLPTGLGPCPVSPSEPGLRGLGPRPPQALSLPLKGSLVSSKPTTTCVRPAPLCLEPGGTPGVEGPPRSAQQTPRILGLQRPRRRARPSGGLLLGGFSSTVTQAGGPGRAGTRRWVAQRGPPLRQGWASPRPSGLHCGLLNPGGPAGRGGGAVWETSSEGWEGCWHLKWLGLLWASPNTRLREPHPRPWAPHPGACLLGHHAYPYTNPRAKAA